MMALCICFTRWQMCLQSALTLWSSVTQPMFTSIIKLDADDTFDYIYYFVCANWNLEINLCWSIFVYYDRCIWYILLHLFIFIYFCTNWNLEINFSWSIFVYDICVPLKNRYIHRGNIICIILISSALIMALYIHAKWFQVNSAWKCVTYAGIYDMEFYQ